MTLDFLPRTQIASSDWDALVKCSPDGWIFALYGWQELILAVESWDFEDFSFGFHENGKLVAVVPLQFNPQNGRMSSSAWGGCGPIISGTLVGKARHRVIQGALEFCIGYARERGATHFDFSISPVTQTALGSLWGINPFVFHGMDDCSGMSQVIDLTSSESQLWAGLSPDARRQIRIAKDKGYTVERASWTENLNDYYILHEETYKRTGVHPHPKAYFEGIAVHMGSTSDSVLWVARSATGAVVAYHNAAWFNSGGSYHTGCSTNDVKQYGVGYLLFWEAICGAKTAGIRWYECGPIFPGSDNTKQQGLSTFKTKFGGQPHRHFISAKLLKSQCSSKSAPMLGPWARIQARMFSLYEMCRSNNVK